MNTAQVNHKSGGSRFGARDAALMQHGQTATNAEASYSNPQPVAHQANPFQSDTESILYRPDGSSTRAQSILDTDDNVSLDSRTFLTHHGQQTAYSSTSTLQAPNQTSSARRSTVSYISGLYNARHPREPKPKKTPGRKVFQVACTVAEVIAPVDFDKDKTSMKESSVYRLFKGNRRESDAGIVGDGSAEQGRARALSVPY